MKTPFPLTRVENTLDPFPNNAKYDSWFDIVLRVVVMLALIGAGVLTLKRRNLSPELEPNEYEMQTLHRIELEETQRPSAAPSFDAFQRNE
jgi:hypothetical protein